MKQPESLFPDRILFHINLDALTRSLQMGKSRFPHQADRNDAAGDRKSTRLNSSHGYISYAVFCLKKKKKARPFTVHILLLRPSASDRRHTDPVFSQIL